jgi:hypothetical protein
MACEKDDAGRVSIMTSGAATLNSRQKTSKAVAI